MTRDYDMHADAHRPMIEPDETISDYGARCYAAGRDEAHNDGPSAHRMASQDLDKVCNMLREIAGITRRMADVHRTAAIDGEA